MAYLPCEPSSDNFFPAAPSFFLILCSANAGDSQACKLYTLGKAVAWINKDGTVNRRCRMLLRPEALEFRPGSIPGDRGLMMTESLWPLPALLRGSSGMFAQGGAMSSSLGCARMCICSRGKRHRSQRRMEALSGCGACPAISWANVADSAFFGSVVTLRGGAPPCVCSGASLVWTPSRVSCLVTVQHWSSFCSCADQAAVDQHEASPAEGLGMRRAPKGCGLFNLEAETQCKMHFASFYLLLKKGELIELIIVYSLAFRANSTQKARALITRRLPSERALIPRSTLATACAQSTSCPKCIQNARNAWGASCQCHGYAILSI